MSTGEVQRQIAHVIDRLTGRYVEVAPDHVTAVVHHAHARFDGRRVRDFVPLLVERAARNELTDHVSA